VHKVTIIPRGRALGHTAYLPIDDKHTYSREFIEGRITSLLGGRSAEILVFNELTTGAADDIDRATELARKMVCEWGMSDKLGPLAFGAREEEIFLGREITRKRNFSEATAVGIDAEIHRIIDAGSERALGLLREHIKELHAMAGALVERETLDSDEIDRIIAGETLPPLEPKAAV
jgi:cell division protease FtsH